MHCDNEQKVKIVGGVFSAQLGMASCYKWDICCVLHASLQPNEMAGKNDRCNFFSVFSALVNHAGRDLTKWTN